MFRRRGATRRPWACPMTKSYVVTGAARGVGRAITEHLTGRSRHRPGPRCRRARLDRAADRCPRRRWRWDEATLNEAVDRAARAGTLSGWVDNAAVSGDAAVHDTPAADVVQLIMSNLGLALAGSAAAIRRFLEDGTAGAVVSVSSHQAQRAVPGVLPYATAKAAVEGLTRQLAAGYAPRGIESMRSRSGRS